MTARLLSNNCSMVFSSLFLSRQNIMAFYNFVCNFEWSYSFIFLYCSLRFAYSPYKATLATENWHEFQSSWSCIYTGIDILTRCDLKQFLHIKTRLVYEFKCCIRTDKLMFTKVLVKPDNSNQTGLTIGGGGETFENTTTKTLSMRGLIITTSWCLLHLYSRHQLLN